MRCGAMGFGGRLESDWLGGIVDDRDGTALDEAEVTVMRLLQTVTVEMIAEWGCWDV